MTVQDNIEYHQPATVEDALKSLAEPGAWVIAGGTDLVIDLRSGDFSGNRLVDVTGIKEMRQLREDGQHISIGAAVKIEDIRQSRLAGEKIPALVLACDKFAGLQVRNQATIGGNVCHAAPCGDTHPPLILYDGQAEVATPAGRETRPVAGLFSGANKSSLKEGELVVRFLLKPETATLADFQKIGRRKDLAISRVSLAVMVNIGDTGLIDRAKIVLGACMATTRRMPKAENALIGQKADMGHFRAVASLMAAEMIEITGRRASIFYKEPAIEGLLLRVLSQLTGGVKCQTLNI